MSHSHPTEADTLARTVWNYLRVDQRLERCDAIFCLTSIDVRVAVRAAELLKAGYGKYIVISGGVAHAGDLLEAPWPEGEAEHFAALVRRSGVPDDKILVEPRALNTGENARFIHELLEQRDLHPRSAIIVQKPYMLRRAYATFAKQWPSEQMKIVMAAPELDYDHYFDASNPKDKVINIMVGDLLRIREYPKLGFQIPQAIPQNVWDAGQQLIELGYDKHLIIAQ